MRTIISQFLLIFLFLPLVAVSHDKGKIAVLQMSSLLKQSDISKRKLTLTRLSSVSIPFTVLSVTANSVNEDFLSVCGLKVLNIKQLNKEHCH